MLDRYVCKGECFESYVEVGEILYYGAGWSHETQVRKCTESFQVNPDGCGYLKLHCVSVCRQNLATPTVTITGTVVHEWNYYTVRTPVSRNRSKHVCSGLPDCCATDHVCVQAGRTEVAWRMLQLCPELSVLRSTLRCSRQMLRPLARKVCTQPT